MATIFDVARLAGVSVATVSRSFSTPSQLSAETERRVLEVAAQLNYRPRKARQAPTSSAGRLPDSSVGTIGFQFFAAAVDNLKMNRFYGPLLMGAMEEAADLGLHLMVHTTNRDRLYDEAPRMVREQSLSGMLLVGTADADVLSAFSTQVDHIVLIDNRDGNGLYDGIVSDGFNGAGEAVRYLHELGHRRIGFLWTTPEAATFGDRYDGYLAASYKLGLNVDRESIYCVQDQVNPYDEVAQYLTRPNRPTALFCVNDHYALVVMQVCKKLGLRVPEDLSIAGFDDTDESAQAQPPLTTLSVPKEYLGQLGVRRLLLRIQSSGTKTESDPPLVIQVPVTLVKRESCCAPAI